jgi:uncharacterized protein (TIGR00290 family)
MAVTDVVLSWSGGKDSAMALRALRQDLLRRVVYLLTTVTEDYDRVSVHGVRRALVEKQADALGLDLFQVMIPATCTNETYQARMVAAISSPDLTDIQTHAFADLFLEDVRAYREANLAKLGKKPLFPVWGRDTSVLAREFIALGFRAVVVCADTGILESDFAGREFDLALLDDLPQDIDPCGENGEFHTFVYDGPGFSHPIPFKRGETVIRDGFAYKDLVES